MVEDPAGDLAGHSADLRRCLCVYYGGHRAVGRAIKISQLINTPKEFQGKELNILVTGVDRSSTDDLSAGAANDSNVNDGMTDMILYVHFNNETGELKMLQIPRDTMVTTDPSVSGNYRINGVAKTQGRTATTIWRPYVNWWPTSTRFPSTAM